MDSHPSRTNRKRWAAVRLAVFERDGYRCRACGRAGRLECDHKVPLWQGGPEWEMSNLQSLCRTDHLRKTSRERRERDGVDPEVERWRRFAGREQGQTRPM